VVATSAHRKAGQELIAFLGAPAAVAIMRSNGFEPK
jgi:ABC-type molybdate transport system substrate-binding protein